MQHIRCYYVSYGHQNATFAVDNLRKVECLRIDGGNIYVLLLDMTHSHKEFLMYNYKLR